MHEGVEGALCDCVLRTADPRDHHDGTAGVERERLSCAVRSEDRQALEMVERWGVGLVGEIAVAIEADVALANEALSAVADLQDLAIRVGQLVSAGDLGGRRLAETRVPVKCG
jgi:hypothetical protein